MERNYYGIEDGTSITVMDYREDIVLRPVKNRATELPVLLFQQFAPIKTHFRYVLVISN